MAKAMLEQLPRLGELLIDLGKKHTPRGMRATHIDVSTPQGNFEVQVHEMFN